MIIYGYIPKRKKRKLTKEQIQRNAEFEKSIAAISPKVAIPASFKTTNKFPVLKPPPGRETPKITSLDTGVKGALTKVGIMKDYHKMSTADRERVDAVNKCVAPMHKSNYVYVSEGMNPAGLGRKNEVL